MVNTLSGANQQLRAIRGFYLATSAIAPDSAQRYGHHVPECQDRAYFMVAMNESNPTTRLDETRWWRRDFLYSIPLLIAAIAAVAFSAADTGLLAGERGWGTGGFFVIVGIFAISTGFPHPVYGHVSFDRLAQVLSILVLGPVDAAVVSGIASFIYPLQRLHRGVPLPSVVTAALHNAGMMMFVVLLSGLLYQYLGGAVPLMVLDFRTGILLVLLIGAMQVVNDLAMMFMLYLRRVDPRQVFAWFSAMIEFVAGVSGVTLALTFNSQPMPSFVLQLAVFAAGMFVIMKYAVMRDHLEKLVDERTQELRALAEEFERKATHDKLTGLPNRRYADDYLQQQIDLALRNNHAGVIALADIDFFKRINDGYSHAVGDQVLIRIARILSEGCRKSDFVARYGGEEFLLCFPETEANQAKQVCGELRRAIQNANWSEISPNLDVTISFGLAEINDGSRRRTVLNDADMRLYRAKREGRNRVIAA